MKVIILTLLAIVAVYSVTHWSELEKTGYNFNSFATEFRRKYNTHEEKLARQEIVESRLKMIIEHNKNPHKTYKMGVNHMLDYTDAELKSMRGVHKGILYSSHATRMHQAPVKIDPEVLKALPKSVDWRTSGVVTPVKDQGRCGSCWTFAAAETIESIYALAKGELVELSEQNILDCTPNPQHCGGTGGCSGGTAELAYDNLKNIGIASEWVYPYNSHQGSDFQCDKSRSSPYAKITGYVPLPSNQQDPLLIAVAKVGPIAISVDASSWHFYASGVFDDCNQTTPDIDHAVQLVGYGTDSAFGDYWLVRNSWTPGWGEHGYIRIKREITPRCGVDVTPADGNGCDGGPPTVTVCGTCGILFDSVYPTYNSTFPPPFF